MGNLAAVTSAANAISAELSSLFARLDLSAARHIEENRVAQAAIKEGDLIASANALDREIVALERILTAPWPRHCKNPEEVEGEMKAKRAESISLRNEAKKLRVTIIDPRPAFDESAAIAKDLDAQRTTGIPFYSGD